MKSVNLLISCVLCITVFYSCSKDSTTTPSTTTPTTSTTTYGTAKGTVGICYDEFWNTIYNRSGFTITATSGSTTVTATSDSTGKYILSKLTSGVYTISISKTGYGIYKVYGFSYYATSDTAIVPQGNSDHISKTSTTVISSISIKNGNLIGKITNPIDAITTSRRVYFYYSTSNSVCYSNYINPINNFNNTNNYTNVASNDSINIKMSDLIWGIGVEPGTKLYIIAYGDVLNPSYYYNGNYVLISSSINPNPSNIISYTVPAN